MAPLPPPAVLVSLPFASLPLNPRAPQHQVPLVLPLLPLRNPLARRRRHSLRPSQKLEHLEQVGCRRRRHRQRRARSSKRLRLKRWRMRTILRSRRIRWSGRRCWRRGRSRLLSKRGQRTRCVCVGLVLARGSAGADLCVRRLAKRRRRQQRQPLWLSSRRVPICKLVVDRSSCKSRCRRRGLDGVREGSEARQYERVVPSFVCKSSTFFVVHFSKESCTSSRSSLIRCDTRKTRAAASASSSPSSAWSSPLPSSTPPRRSTSNSFRLVFHHGQHTPATTVSRSHRQRVQTPSFPASSPQLLRARPARRLCHHHHHRTHQSLRRTPVPLHPRRRPLSRGHRPHLASHGAGTRSGPPPFPIGILASIRRDGRAQSRQEVHPRGSPQHPGLVDQLCHHANLGRMDQEPRRKAASGLPRSLCLWYVGEVERAVRGVNR